MWNSEINCILLKKPRRDIVAVILVKSARVWGQGSAPLVTQLVKSLGAGELELGIAAPQNAICYFNKG